ncbi:MAG: histidine kinase, partial [Cytophagales bacterium]
MPNPSSPASVEFYRDNTKLKWIILVASMVISIGTIFFTNVLVTQLKERERNQVKLFARALEYTINDTENNILFITEEIINKNNSIPTILTDEKNNIISYRNIDVDSAWSERRKQMVLADELSDMIKTYPPIEVLAKDPGTQKVLYTQRVYYRNSFLLSELIAYPYIEIAILAIFGFISYLAFNYSRTSEQNRVWVGLAKETAHQLGTPLSSLMAWIEVLRDDPELKKKGVVDELDKDIQKLRMVTERFSS